MQHPVPSGSDGRILRHCQHMRHASAEERFAPSMTSRDRLTARTYLESTRSWHVECAHHLRNRSHALPRRAASGGQSKGKDFSTVGTGILNESRAPLRRRHSGSGGPNFVDQLRPTLEKLRSHDKASCVRHLRGSSSISISYVVPGGGTRKGKATCSCRSIPRTGCRAQKRTVGRTAERG